MANQTAKIRVKLRGYDSLVVDKAAKSIIETAVSTGAKVAGPIPLLQKGEGCSKQVSIYLQELN